MIAPMGDAETVLERCDLLARCSEEPDRLTRRFATTRCARRRPPRISHHPDESVRAVDVAAALDATTRFVERLAADCA
jgi:hypothetical protein